MCQTQVHTRRSLGRPIGPDAISIKRAGMVFIGCCTLLPFQLIAKGTKQIAVSMKIAFPVVATPCVKNSGARHCPP